LRKNITVILIAICIAVFAISANALISYYSADKAAESDFAGLLPPELAGSDVAAPEGGKSAFEALLPYYKGLHEENEDMVGWLRIPGTRVSYPVMQTFINPEYYLDKNFQREYTTSGTLFASSISDVTLPSDVVIIYGHRMKTGAMFGSLGDFLNEDFLLEHDTVIFDTLTERNEYKIYLIFTLAVGPDVINEFDYFNYNMFRDKAEFDGFMNRAYAHSETVNPLNTPIFGDKLLLLSTCEYTHENGRLVLVAVRQ